LRQDNVAAVDSSLDLISPCGEAIQGDGRSHFSFDNVVTQDNSLDLISPRGAAILGDGKSHFCVDNVVDSALDLISPSGDADILGDGKSHSSFDRKEACLRSFTSEDVSYQSHTKPQSKITKPKPSVPGKPRRKVGAARRLPPGFHVSYTFGMPCCL
jgi:hypothetical protein